MLSRLARTIAAATAQLEQYEYASSRAEVERFFWSDLCDNYLELAKARLYGEAEQERYAAQWTLYQALLSVLKMLAPHLPYITEEIYQGLFRQWDEATSVHLAEWPLEHPEWIDAEAESVGGKLLELLHQVRRYKAERGLSVGAELKDLHIRSGLSPAQRAAFEMAMVDCQSATRARRIVLADADDPALCSGELAVEVY